MAYFLLQNDQTVRWLRLSHDENGVAVHYHVTAPDGEKLLVDYRIANRERLFGILLSEGKITEPQKDFFLSDECDEVARKAEELRFSRYLLPETQINEKMFARFLLYEHLEFVKQKEAEFQAAMARVCVCCYHPSPRDSCSVCFRCDGPVCGSCSAFFFFESRLWCLGCLKQHLETRVAEN